MKIIAKFENGEEQELKEIQGINKEHEILIVKVKCLYKPEDREAMEEELSKKLNKKVIILDSRYGEILATI